MKKIAIVAPDYFFTIPSIYGGACEELMTILINQNEINKKADFVLIQREFDKQKMQELGKVKFNNTKTIYLKRNKFYDYVVKSFNKLFKILKINKKLPTSYEKKVVKFLNNNKVDKIILEAHILPNANKLNYQREQIYTHLHTQDTDKKNYFKHIGNVIGVSNFVCQDWDNYLTSQNTSDVKLHVLPNVVNENKFKTKLTAREKSDLRQSLDLLDDDFVVVFCGRIVKVKGVKPLMESILQLDPKIKLLVIGSPNFTKKRHSKYLHDVVTLANNNPDKIKFTGYIPNQELYKYYQIANVQVAPSIWEEASGLIAIEGMLCELPQIITRSGGMIENVNNSQIIVDKNENLIENLKNAINTVYCDISKRNSMILANKNDSEKYSSKQYLDNLSKIIED